MRKEIDALIDLIKYKYFEIFSLITLSFWTISPFVEFLLGNRVEHKIDFYWVMIIKIIGLLGIIEYFVYLYKQKKDGLLKKNNYFPEILILIMLFLSIVSSILSKDPTLSFVGDLYRKEGLIVYIMYIGFMLSSSIIKEKKYIKIIAQTIIFSAFFITLIPLFRYNFTYTSFTNIYYNSNHYGYFIMISIMLSIFMFMDSNGIKRIIYGIIYVFLLYILIRNNTFGCYLAVSVTLIVLLGYVFIKKEKRLITIFVLLIFVLTSFFVSHYDIKVGERIDFRSTKGLVLNNFLSLFSDTATILNNNATQNETDSVGTHRGLLWKEAFNYTLKHPLIGGGMECLAEYYQEVKEKKNTNYYNDRPHNVILQFSSFIGIPGALVYLTFIFYLALKGLKRIKCDTIKMMIYFTSMCYFISSMFGNSMYYTSPYYMILIGLLIGINRYKEYD